MSIEDIKPGDFVKLDFGTDAQGNPPEFAKLIRPTHYPPTPRATLYSIEVGENGDMPFFAHPSTNKRSMN